MPARLTASAIRAFAEKHRLKVVTDRGDGTPIIQGRRGQVYEYDARHLAVMCISEGSAAWTPKKYGNARRACEAVGMTVLQDGDSEGSFRFDPSDRAQAKLAIEVASCKAKRVLTAEQRQRAGERLRAYREGKSEGLTVLQTPPNPTLAVTLAA